MSMNQLSSSLMESFDEEEELALTAQEKSPSSPSKPKLKRLKKAAASSIPQALGIPRVPDAPIMPIPESSEIRTGSSDATENEGFGEETGPAPELDPLFVYRSGEEMMGDPDVQDVKVEKGGGGNDEEVVVVEESEKEKNVKRKLNLEDEGEDPTMKKKKGKSRKLTDPIGKPKESVRERKRIEKERKAELEHLHAESQRLLRETRNASFKPVQLLQKPISSVLEKIRLRKLEILKSSNVLGSLPFVDNADCTAGSDCKAGPVNSQSDIKGTDRNECVINKVQNNMKDDVAPEDTTKNPTNDSEEDKGGFQLSTRVDNLLNSQEVIPSHPLNSCLNIDGGGDDGGDASSSDYDVSSSEEESDKENISPSARNVLNEDSSPKDGIAKAFLDDEAEEEDDSDCDLLRFRENEDEDETDEHEELDDLIATGYEEAPMDQEKRNELHQKWLEQQDAAETDNVLQRLKSGRQGLGKTALIHGGDYDNYDRSDNDDDEGNDDDNDGDDEALYKKHPIDMSHQTLKKAKQMISRMFTDANDVYVPSDDEETEKNLIRRHMLKHHEEPSLISPVEDESSREFFGLIKKLNIAPSAKKRAKVSAPPFDSLIMAGSSNSSSKSSFLNRANNSLSSSFKQRSISVKTYIFSRDDSNSRSHISTSEITSEMAEKGGVSAKNSKKDGLSSQVKSSITKRSVQAESETGSSLFNILRQSAIQFDKKVESKQSLSSRVDIEKSEAAHKFSAFKVRRSAKMDSRT